jgi:hypothetical protein
METAVTGEGIALGRRSVTRRYSGGKAGSPVRTQLARSYCHYAVYPISSESNPALVAFRDWLIEEACRVPATNLIYPTSRPLSLSGLFGFCRQRQDAGQMAVRICEQRLRP